MTAQMLWSEAYSGNYTLAYDYMIKQMMPRLREQLKDISYPSLKRGAQEEVIAENPLTFPPKLPAEQKADISVSGAYKSIIFCHTELSKLTRLPWQGYDQTGKYILTYDDGTQEELPINNCGNIGHWNRRQNEPLAPQLYRHSGYICTYSSDGIEFKTEAGENVTLYKYEHVLPQGKKLINIKLWQNPDFDTKIFLWRVSGVN